MRMPSLLALLLLSSALVRPAAAASAEPFYLPPDDARFSLGDASPSQTARWWEAFGDPALDELVGRLLAESPDLAQSRSRLALARSGARGSLSPLAPVVHFTSGVSTAPYDSLTFGCPIPSVATDDPPDTYTSASATFSGALSVDPWGTALREHRAGQLDAVAAAGARHCCRVCGGVRRQCQATRWVWAPQLRTVAEPTTCNTSYRKMPRPRCGIRTWFDCCLQSSFGTSSRLFAPWRCRWQRER